MPKDPVRHSENDSAPFKRTSEAAAERRQAPEDIFPEADEKVNPPVMPGDDASEDAIPAVTNVSRGNLMTPTRLRRPDERNPELDPKPADRDKR